MKDNPYLMSLITQIGVMFASLCTLIGTLIQSSSARKLKKQSEILAEVHKEILDLKNYTDKQDIEINNKIDDITIASCKASLVSIMSRIKNGYKPTDEEKRILIETYDYYTNKLHGNSYVHEMYLRLHDNKLI